MKDLQYQQEAIEQLKKLINKLLNVDELRQKLVFKAPTGSGKTYMTAMAMEQVADVLRSDPRNVYENIAFVWIAPNRLHSQAYDILKKLFDETRSLNPIMYDNITDGRLRHGDVLCLNWGSIHSEDNIMVRNTESGHSLWEIVENTKRDKVAIVAIIDEEHLHWEKTADRAAIVLNRLKPIVEVRVSATPKTTSSYTVTIPRKDVIAAQMIKEGIVINPEIVNKDSVEVEDYLIDEALNKRNLLAECYAEMDKKINPLLLIQLPNDSSTVSVEDKTVRDQIITYLNDQYKISFKSGELAMWLSDKSEKINLDGIEKPDSQVKVLLFKEAIAKGWDCPRAAVLLIFRKLQDNNFAIQTLGRILRMPEQKYYFNSLLNKGYVYTNIATSRIAVTGESEDYWKQNLITAYRRENINNVSLQSVYEFYPAFDRNRLGTDFAQFLYEFIKKHWLQSAVQGLLFGLDDNGNMVVSETLPGFGEDIASNRAAVEAKQKIRFNVKGVSISIPKDLNIQNEEKEITVGDAVEYTRTNEKIYKIFIDYCRSLLTRYEKSASTPILASAIMDVMERLFELSQWETIRIVMSDKPVNNNAKFTDLFTRALDEYFPRVESRKAEAKERSYIPWMWQIPESRTYNANKNTDCPDVENHALIPYVKDNRNRIQERKFVNFLEENTEYIDWWYKNGDEGRMHYAIEYFNPEYNKKRLFYVDFIIRLKNGDIYLFDTKGSGLGGDMESEAVLCAKHNALIDYISNGKNKAIKGGGIIKAHGGAWRYNPRHISSLDITNWNSFFPDQLI